MYIHIYIYIYIERERDTVCVCVYIYIQYLTEVSTPLTFFLIFSYIFSRDNIEEMTLQYNVK